MKTVQVGGHCITFKPLVTIGDDARRKAVYFRLRRALQDSPDPAHNALAAETMVANDYAYIVAMQTEASFEIPSTDASGAALLKGLEVYLGIESIQFGNEMINAINELVLPKGDPAKLPAHEVSEEAKKS